jgi:hypothetical protein
MAKWVPPRELVQKLSLIRYHYRLILKYCSRLAGSA